MHLFSLSLNNFRVFNQGIVFFANDVIFVKKNEYVYSAMIEFVIVFLNGNNDFVKLIRGKILTCY